jgi:hypothetical protein
MKALSMALLWSVAGLVFMFWWGRTPPLQTAPHPAPPQVLYHTHDVGGFHLKLGKRDWLLPPGSQLSVPYQDTPADTLPDWTKV